MVDVFRWLPLCAEEDHPESAVLHLQQSHELHPILIAADYDGLASKPILNLAQHPMGNLQLPCELLELFVV